MRAQTSVSAGLVATLFLAFSLLPLTAFAEGDLYNNPTPPDPATIATLYAGQIYFTATTSSSIGSYRMWFFQRDDVSKNPATITCRVFYNIFNDSTIHTSGNSYPYTDLTQTFTGTIPPYLEATYHWGEIDGTWGEIDPCYFKAGDTVVVGLTPFGDPYWHGDNIAGVLSSPPPPVLYESTTTQPGNVYQHIISPHFPRPSTVQPSPFGTNGEFFFYNTLGTTTLTSVSEFLLWTRSRYFGIAPTQLTPTLVEYVHGTPGSPLCVGTPIDVSDPSKVFTYFTRAPDTLTGYNLTFDHYEDGFYYGTVPLQFLNCTIPPSSGDSFYSINLLPTAGGSGAQLGTLRDPSIIPPAGSQSDYRFNVEASVNGSLATTTPTPTGASNVLFLPGIKGSVLKVNNDTVWPPSFWSDDLSELALTTAGDSVNPVVVDDVLETFYGTPIYSGFTAFMDELVASGTTTEWKALPYDWRFSPEKIITDGVQTPTGIMDPIEEIERLAVHSETGKVTIVAHSMGGLLGKAIIKKLQDEGKEDLIDSFIMVGTPQLGTPQAAASLLHGDDEGILAGFIVDSAMVRKIAQNFQSTYDLLPSPRYFDEVTEPVIVFDPNALFTQEWRDYWGPMIDSYTEFFSFITGNGVTRLDPEFTKLQIPEILRTDLTEHARDFHNVYDTYAFPDSIRVVQVAGWGMPTVKAIKYERRHFMQNYKPLFTIEGDKTVVYPSVISTNLAETYFLNLSLFNKNESQNIQHRNLLNAVPTQKVIKEVIERKSISEVDYISVAKPPLTELGTQLVVSTHSPVILGAYDATSNFTGINPNQDLGADVLLITEDIPSSTFLAFGDSQYLFLPKEGSYTVAFNGIGSGPTDVDIENFASDTSTLVATYSDISVTASTSATFIVNSASPQDAHIQIDLNNDGQVDMYIAPDNQPLTLNELLTNLKTTIQNLAIKEKLKTNLLKKIKNIEKKIAKQKNKKASKAVMNLEKQIIKKGAKGKLSDADVAKIVQLLEQIERAL